MPFPRFQRPCFATNKRQAWEAARCNLHSLRGAQSDSDSGST
jgi:hypothetical protein